jgi:DNA polymerase-3 subunit epsilon
MLMYVYMLQEKASVWWLFIYVFTRAELYKINMTSMQPICIKSLCRSPSASKIIVDIETTGLSPQNDRIVSIAAALTPETQSSLPNIFSKLVNPNRSVPARAVAVHGLTDAALCRQPDWSVIGAEFWSWVFGHNTDPDPVILVGHNIDQFDMPFILAESARFQEYMPKRNRDIVVMDTLLMSRKIFPRKILASKKQCNIHEHLFDEQPDHQHTALGDVMALKRIFEHIKFRKYIETDANAGVVRRYNYKL